MKKILTRRRSFRHNSFTLVELLVVIAIIALLAAVLTSAAGYALRAAQRAKAANLANQIQSSALAYYTEYSLYPVGPATKDTDATAQIGDLTANALQWGNLIEALSGNIKPSNGLAATQTSITNSRNIGFLSLKSSDVDANDAPKNPLVTGNEIYFNIAMDADYDGLLGFATGPGGTAVAAPAKLPNLALSPFTAAAAQSGGTSTAGVAVWANCNASSSSTNAGFYVRSF